MRPDERRKQNGKTQVVAMNWDEIKKLDYAEIESFWNEPRAEPMYEAFNQSRDLSDWAQYLKHHPPSPEVLAFLVGLGLEKHQKMLRVKGGRAKGAANRKIIDDAIANRGEKSQKVVEAELRDKNIPQRTITRHIAGKWPKKTKT
jgi:hypothetical protein